MRACWLKWAGRDWSISADYIWLNYSDANNPGNFVRREELLFVAFMVFAGEHRWFHACIYLPS